MRPANEARIVRGPEGEYIARVNLSTDDAALIAHCVNSHDQLMGALREAEFFIAGALPHFKRDREDATTRVLPIIRAALLGGGMNGVKHE